MKEYKVIIKLDAKSFSAAVSAALMDGWILYGEPCFEGMYKQVVVR